MLTQRGVAEIILGEMKVDIGLHFLNEGIKLPLLFELL